MERILDQLRAHAHAAPHDVLLRDTISILAHIHRHPEGPFPTSWDTLQSHFQILRDRGLWKPSTENDTLLDALRILLTSPLKEPRQQISVVIPPAQSVVSQLIFAQDHLVLPAELIDILNNAYFLHILATDPAQVVPPGKSLLSVMSRSRTLEGDSKPTLHSKVEVLVHKAFWDEAVDTLSNPEPSVQLPRLKSLYGDLHVALSPLLPLEHPILLTLSSPLSPTSSPLNSTLTHLREVLTSLRERCAPVRDSEIEALQQSIADPSARSFPPAALATLVTETTRGILTLSETMKDDLSQFFLGNMTEQQLRSVVERQAKTTERELVIDVWRQERIMQGWKSWLDELVPPAHLPSISAGSGFLWIVRTVQALGSSLPVTCPLPSRTVRIPPSSPRRHDKNENMESSTPNVNTLPAIFFFSAPALLKTQNYLQALVIAASLRTLTRLPSNSRSEPSDPDSFMSRIWTLLCAEIVGEPSANDTKLINLADEVVLAWTRANTKPVDDKEGEATLRAAVDRTLRTEDPVFKLLQRRLLTELSNVLVKRHQEDAGTNASLPVLRAGRDRQPVGKRPKLVLNLEDMDGSRSPGGLPRMAIDIKGFEDPVLNSAVTDVFKQLDDCLSWVESVWSDVIGMGSVSDIDNLRKNT